MGEAGDCQHDLFWSRRRQVDVCRLCGFETGGPERFRAAAAWTVTPAPETAVTPLAPAPAPAPTVAADFSGHGAGSIVQPLVT